MTLRHRYAWLLLAALTWLAPVRARAQHPATQEVSGTVVWADADSRQVAVRRPDAPETAAQSAVHRVEHYRIADGVGIVRNGRWAGIDALQAGDRVAMRVRPEDLRTSWPIAEAVVAVSEADEVTESGAAGAASAPSG